MSQASAKVEAALEAKESQLVQERASRTAMEARLEETKAQVEEGKQAMLELRQALKEAELSLKQVSHRAASLPSS